MKLSGSLLFSVAFLCVTAICESVNGIKNTISEGVSCAFLSVASFLFFVFVLFCLTDQLAFSLGVLRGRREEIRVCDEEGKRGSLLTSL